MVSTYSVPASRTALPPVSPALPGPLRPPSAVSRGMRRARRCQRVCPPCRIPPGPALPWEVVRKRRVRGEVIRLCVGCMCVRRQPEEGPEVGPARSAWTAPWECYRIEGRGDDGGGAHRGLVNMLPDTQVLIEIQARWQRLADWWQIRPAPALILYAGIRCQGEPRVVDCLLESRNFQNYWQPLMVYDSSLGGARIASLGVNERSSVIRGRGNLDPEV